VGAVALLGAVLDLFGEVKAAVLKKYEKTVVKMGLLQVAASKAMITDLADLLESTRKDEGWTSSKKTAK